MKKYLYQYGTNLGEIRMIGTRAALFVIGLLITATQPVFALNFRPDEFGALLNATASLLQSEVRVHLGGCVFGPKCYYDVGALHITVEAQPDGEKATNIRLESGPENGTKELKGAEPILIAMCLSSAERQNASNYADALSMSYENGRTALRHGSISVDGISFTLYDLEDSLGRVIEVSDSPRSTQNANIIPSTDNEPSTTQGRRLSSKHELLDAFIYFEEGVETDDKLYSRDRYVTDNDLWLSGLFIGKAPGGFNTEYSVDSDCNVRRIISAPKDPQKTFTTLFRLGNLDGRWHWERASRQLVGDQIAWILSASGRNVTCNIGKDGQERCEDDLTSLHYSGYERDRAAKAIEVITARYCEHTQAKPF